MSEGRRFGRGGLFLAAALIAAPEVAHAQSFGDVLRDAATSAAQNTLYTIGNEATARVQDRFDRRRDERQREIERREEARQLVLQQQQERQALLLERQSVLASISAQGESACATAAQYGLIDDRTERISSLMALRGEYRSMIASNATTLDADGSATTVRLLASVDPYLRQCEDGGQATFR